MTSKVSGYIRMEQKSGLIGIYEKENPNTVWEDHCPWEAENELFEADYDRIMPWLENAMDRMPIFAELGIKREVHGAISHPPDGNPLIGPHRACATTGAAAARRSASAGAPA
jgi:dimethylglycine dehydrogenase